MIVLVIDQDRVLAISCPNPRAWRTLMAFVARDKVSSDSSEARVRRFQAAIAIRFVTLGVGGLEIRLQHLLSYRPGRPHFNRLLCCRVDIMTTGVTT